MNNSLASFREETRAPGSAGAVDRRQAVKERVGRHVRHLDALTQTLRQLGVNDAAIFQHVAEISAEYRSELLRNIDRI